MCTRSSSRCLSPPARSCSALYRTLRHVALVVVLPRLCVSGFEDQADRSESSLVRSCRVASNNGLLEEIEDFTIAADPGKSVEQNEALSECWSAFL